MKIACTADWHLFNFTDFSTIKTVEWDEDIRRYVEVDEPDDFTISMNSRLFNQLDGICEMRDFCERENIHNILMAGDLFHHRETVDVSVMNPIYDVLSSFYSAGINITIIAGNHDQVDNSMIPQSSVYPFKDIENVDIIEKPELTQIIDNDEIVDLVAIPYSKDKDFIMSAIEVLSNQVNDVNTTKNAILMVHLGITGGEVGSGQYSMVDEYSLKDLRYDKWKYVVAGHYHRPQMLEYNTFYCGSILQNNFGDEIKGDNGYNGFFVIDTEKRWDVRFVPIKQPRFMTLTPDELSKKPDLAVDNYIRVKASAKESDKVKKTIDKLSEDADSSVNIRMELEKEYVSEHRSDIGVTNSFDETVTIYADEKYDGEYELDRVKLMGLDILHEAMGV